MATPANAPKNMMRRPSGGPVVDTHAHWHAPDFVALLEREAGAHGAEVARNDRGFVTLRLPGIRSVFQPHYMDLETRLKAMDATGVDMHALSLTSPMVNWAPPEFGLKLAQVYNDSLAKAHRDYPTRFVGMATLPMQTPELALKELERAAKLPGIRGAYMATHING
jgi:aminocarboxymuconate-semialdehyde decarboxylase